MINVSNIEMYFICYFCLQLLVSTSCILTVTYFTLCPYLRRLILSTCGCLDYEEILIENNDDEYEEEEDDDDDDNYDNPNSDKYKAQELKKLQRKEREELKEILKELPPNVPILKMAVMVKKLHLDPGSFSSLTDSIKKFLKSLPDPTERTILSCYVAERYDTERRCVVLCTTDFL